MPGVVTADELPDDGPPAMRHPTRRRSSTRFVVGRDRVVRHHRPGRAAARPGRSPSTSSEPSTSIASTCGRRRSPRPSAVVDLLRALVDHLVRVPRLVDADSLEQADPVRAAVGYVAGMTDRFACRLALQELDYPTDRLPRGIDIPA